MNEKVDVKKNYDVNIKMSALYELLDSFYHPLENNYPDDVKKNIEILIDSMNKYLYHAKVGYDIVDEKYFTTVSYRKNDSNY